MRNEENPRAGGSETAKKVAGFFLKKPATPPQKYL